MFIVQRDSRLAWMVCFSCFLAMVTVDGVGNSFGVVMDPLVLLLDSTVANVSWFKSSNTAFQFLFASLASFMLKKVGYRVIILIGTILCTASYIASAFLKNYVGLFFTFGVLGGAGTGMLWTPANIACAEYFDRWKGVSTGIAMSGGGIGTMIVPLFCNFVTINN